MDDADPAEPAALLEREREVESVREALRAASRHVGGTLVIEGPAGIGKSRLLDEARARAAGLGVRVFNARATELEQGFPFGIVRELFERPLQAVDTSERERWLAGAATLGAEVLTGTQTMVSNELGAGPSTGDPGYATHHGLYWLASNIAVDAPLALIVDDLQWCDAPSAGALAFVARRLEGQPLALIIATRPLDPAVTPEAATLVADPAAELLRPSPLTQPAMAALVAARLSADPDERFVRACAKVTGGNPFLLGELLTELAERNLKPTAAASVEVGAIVPRGVANAVLLRLARLAPQAAALARALSVLGDGAQVGDAARLAGLAGAELEAGMAALVSAGVAEPGGSVRFAHPMLRAAIYGDLSPAERERLHQAAASILRERGAPADEVAAQVMHTEPAADPEAVALLRDAAREALALGDAAGAAALLARGLEEPPAEQERAAFVLELGQAQARAGLPEAIAPLTEIATQAEDPEAIAAAAIELSGMLFFSGRAAEAAAVLRSAQERVPAGGHPNDALALALLGISYTSVSARHEAGDALAELREPDRSARGVLPAATLALLAMDEVLYLRSAVTAGDLAERALKAGLPVEPHHAWAGLALAVLAISDRFDTARDHADQILAEAQARGAALTVASVLAHRAFIEVRRGNVIAAETDADAAIELATDFVGSDFVLVLAVPAAVTAGLDRGATIDSLRRLIDDTGVRDDTPFMARSLVRYCSGLLRAAAGNHEAAIEELRGCEQDHPVFGGENPAFIPWRTAAALSLAELGRHGDAHALAAEEVRRARSFGAARPIGAALRVQAIVGPTVERAATLEAARAVLAPSPARLDLARVLVDIGATSRAAGRRTAAREPLLEGLELAARCGARTLERRARAELAAIGIRPRTTDRTGTDSLTPSERRVVELAAAGGTNRAIAQTLFVTEKTVETHMGRAFRKLTVSSRRQLPDVLAAAAG
jgi:DNA-binding CsgD family transcriptional regulator/tetratricopeptide (TPR) repeat protein